MKDMVKDNGINPKKVYKLSLTPKKFTSLEFKRFLIKKVELSDKLLTNIKLNTNSI